jgi:hypothetical protein
LKSGANDHLDKPLNMEDVKNAMKKFGIIWLTIILIEIFIFYRFIDHILNMKLSFLNCYLNSLLEHMS